jgi:hypothetical protein
MYTCSIVGGMTEIRIGDIVRYGISKGKVVGRTRKYGEEGVVVMERNSAYTRWIPLHMVEVIEEA